MGLFNRPAAGTLADRCDRCGAAGNVRVGKYIASLREYNGQPHAVDSRELDLVLCGHDFDVHLPALRQQGWRVIEAAR